MKNPETIIRLHRSSIFSDKIQLHLAHRFETGSIGIPRPLEMNLFDPDQTSCIPEQPLFSFYPTEAQHLMDELWNLGIRPTEGHGSTGQLAATEKHLAHVTGLLEKTLTTSLNVANATLLPHITPKS